MSPMGYVFYILDSISSRVFFVKAVEPWLFGVANQVCTTRELVSLEKALVPSSGHFAAGEAGAIG